MAEKDKLKLSKTSHLSKILANAKKNIKTGAKEVGGFLLSEADKYIGEPYRATKRVGDVITGKRKKSEIGPMDVVEALSMGLGSGVPFAPKGANVAGITKKVALRQAKGDPDDYYMKSMPRPRRNMIIDALQSAVDEIPERNWKRVRELHVGVSKANQGLQGGYYGKNKISRGKVTINPYEIRRNDPVYYRKGLKNTLFHEMTHSRQDFPFRGKSARVKRGSSGVMDLVGEAELARRLEVDSEWLRHLRKSGLIPDEAQRVAYHIDPTEVHAREVARLTGSKTAPFNTSYESKLEDIVNTYKYTTARNPNSFLADIVNLDDPKTRKNLAESLHKLRSKDLVRYSKRPF